MNSFALPEPIGLILAILALAIPVAFSYTAIKRRRAVGAVLLQWRPSAVRLAMFLWAAAGIWLSILVYRYTTSASVRIVFIAAFFAGWMNALGSTIIIGEKGVFVRRTSIPWEKISQFSLWDKSGKHFIRIIWNGGDERSVEQTATFVVPRRMIAVTTAIFRNYIPSIQIPGSN